MPDVRLPGDRANACPTISGGAEDADGRNRLCDGGLTRHRHATAARLARDGFRVVAMDRARDVLEPNVDRLRADGLDIVAAAADVCDRASIAAVLNAYPRVDVIVCAAGISTHAMFLDLDEAAFRQVLDVNVVGTFIPAQEAARRMQRGGRIITISSRSALGGTSFAHYVASPIRR